MEALVYIGVSFCVIGFLGSAIALGKIFSSAIENVSRNPSAESKISKFAFVGAGFAESMGLFSLVVALMLLFI